VLCNKSRNIAKDESLVLSIPPEACVQKHPILLSPDRKILQLNLCKSRQIPATRPAICVCRGGGPISVLDQTSAQTRESVGRAVVTPLQVPEQTELHSWKCPYSPPSLRHWGSERGLHFFYCFIYGSHSYLTPKM